MEEPVAILGHPHSSILGQRKPFVVGDEEESSVTNGDLPRSASYTYLPLAADPDAVNFPLKRTFSDNVVNAVTQSQTTRSSKDVVPVATPVDEVLSTNEHHLTSQPGTRNSRLGIARLMSFSHQSRGSVATFDSQKSEVSSTSNLSALKSRAVSGSFSYLSRKSWIATSRSPSPVRREELKDGKATQENISLASAGFNSARRSILRRRKSEKSLKEAVSQSAGQESSIAPRSLSVDSFSTRRLSQIPGKLVSRVTDQPNFFRRPSSEYGVRTVDPSLLVETVPPLPKNPSADKLNAQADTPRKKDELWTVFRNLDAAFQKFEAKASALKTNVVRTSLLPFLRDFAHHDSTKRLRAEDVDRRVIILNKWWMGLLEMLNGKSNQMISGTDRPALLEGITGIMVRPEWRLPLTGFSPLRDRSPSSSLRSRSSTSLESSASDFLVESVYHNVRNMFIRNLMAQMTLVVDKMSMRNAPASLVTFCGKATAYAYFFCPGIAEVLVRLWCTPTDLIRRAVSDLSTTADADEDLEQSLTDILSAFPQCTHSLAFTSLVVTARKLRRRPHVPPPAISIDWDGPWIARWSGRDSDLFFVFAKHFFILASDFLPADTSRRALLQVPGLVVVNAQILKILDSTIHKQFGLTVSEDSVPFHPATFDDLLSGTDASASNLPVPAANGSRFMAEHRLIMLLRDFLAERIQVSNEAKELFAGIFSGLLKAAAQRISVFDHDACVTLCDFLEEAIAILSRYSQSLGRSSMIKIVDWGFWLDVCKHMLESHNTMTEMRLFALLYSMWGLITVDEPRKREVCLQWLLEFNFFGNYFMHWCPMVRSYYMRLVCWRMARYDGDPSDLDLEIFEALFARLKYAWNHFFHLQRLSLRDNTLPPSTIPSLPAPGRRLIIIRTDGDTSSGGVLISFDGILPSSLSGRLTDLVSILDSPGIPSGAPSGTLKTTSSNSNSAPTTQPAAKSRWSVLRNMVSLPSSSDDIHTSENRDQTDAEPVTVIDQSPRSQDSHESVPPPSRHYRQFSFRFSLDWADRSYVASRERRLFPPRLPKRSQSFLQANRPDGLATSSPPTFRSQPADKYVGRALAEWALVVEEHQNFVDRRKSEGVPGDRWVEIPSLGFEAIRRPG